MAKRTPPSTTGTPRTRSTTTTRSKRTNGAAPPPETRQQPNEDDIRLRAYHRYLERGGGHGSDWDDWIEAEKDLKAHRS
jgi:hypothetical protein